jgi:hypothetical protein
MHAEDREMAEDVVEHLLMVARGIVHNEHILGNNPGKFQSALVKFGVLLPTTALIASDNDDIVEEALALLVEVLDDGNADAQAAFMDYFLNTNEETFFVDVHEMLKSDIEEVQEVH